MTARSDDPPVVARVVPNVTGIDKSFDYLVPPALRADVTVGTIVRVPLAGRRVGGWVVALADGSGDSARGGTTDLAPERLKPIAKVTGLGPSPELIDLASWAAHRWAGRLRAILATASPPRAVRALPPERTSGWGSSSGGSAGAPAAPEPVIAGLDALLAAGGGVVRRAPASDPLPLLEQVGVAGPLLVVVPAVDGAQVLAARLRATGRSVALLPRDWAAAAAGVDVVIGSRAAVWAPAAGCRAIVVLDEHDEALQEERNPTWHARDVAIERAARAGIACLLVSPAPTLAALAWAGDRVRRPSRLDERAGWPLVDIVDRGDEEPWVTSMLSSTLIRHLRDHERRVVCVLNAPGRARRLACRNCRELTVCEVCASAVRQDDDGTLRCARCGAERPPVCQACGSSALAVLRPGVRRLREEIEAAAGRPVVEVTGASADDVPLADADVLVGTEAVLHRVRDADVVAFLDMDAELLAPRFRAAEQAMALLVRAARLVGPRADGGRIVVQTRLPRHEVLDAVLHADPDRLVAGERARRRALGFPPETALASVDGPGAPAYAAALRNVPGLAVSGQGPALVRARDWETLADGLAAVARPSGSRVRVEVDPPRI